MELAYFLVILAVLLFGFAVLFYFVKQRTEKKEDGAGLTLLQNQLQNLSQVLDTKLSDSAKMVQEQSNQMSGNVQKVIREITEQLTRVDEGQKQVSKFADQLQTLQDTLKNPKQRGVFGEYYLETLLQNVLGPKNYQMQYAFKDGEIVDAALFFGDKIIPIDSKFSLENYNRIAEEKDANVREQLEKEFKNDLKKRIDETSKYIRPEEGTTEFAFMFIPAEGVYYDLLVNKVGAIKTNTRDLLDYAARDKKVHIVSPTTFYVTLQAMMESLRSYQIQESTKDILKNVSQLERHLAAYNDAYRKVGTHLSTTVNMYNSSQKEFRKIDKDILRIGGEGVGAEVELLDRPQAAEED
ncbi:MAG: DNA recombination protein RmuC [Candidatus Harrisonbacteria bacterium CG10_big_fil_rev_8_21_14_0_10_44_23]|uniref:DNA recombination protein RmuC n=1 Tax=Candidatus Harrisonbacteria bacterium CG10_big_fil_rev_8_21_14_0_10_44_23 TaxID=1974585 RepID=A0A2H0UQM0_9BACT|nr:MAG: DNA recombination protein RmuC [Candidatus Harrisonbacteria bacterium CG10_big_fil_rev_8_21_14_0_10_44_23]